MKINVNMWFYDILERKLKKHVETLVAQQLGVPSIQVTAEVAYADENGVSFHWKYYEPTTCEADWNVIDGEEWISADDVLRLIVKYGSPPPVE